MKFLCEQCKAKYQIADEKAVGKTVRMKCRKCGHLIEVRAAVTETSVSSSLPEHIATGVPQTSPPVAPPATPQAPAHLSPPASPPVPPPASQPSVGAPSPLLTGTFATGGGGAVKVAPRPERPAGALEGAFKSAVQSEAALAAAAVAPPRPAPRDEEPSTPFDMSDLSPSDEWYVAINGVPVGPIRVAEIRRKAALGAVTEDSLVWQEGLDEWRPLRSFPELAASVREAMTRLSRPPTAELRATAPPPPPSRSARPVPSGNAPRAVPPRTTAPASAIAAIARSNVVPIMSRLATAEKLEPAPQPRNSPVPGPPAPPPPLVVPMVVPDPFASAPAVQPAPVAAAAMPAAASIAPPPASRQVNWIPLAMVAMAVAFGVTAAIAIFRPAAPAPAPTAEQAAPVAAPAAVPAATAIAAATASEAPERAAGTAPAAPRNAGGPRASGATANAANGANAGGASGGGRSLDLHSLTQSGAAVTPTDEPGGDTPKPAGQSLTESQVQQAVALHHTAITRGCWERNPTAKQAVNVTVTLTVGGDGSAQNVAASGDDPSVAKCIENDVRGWRFPATGSSQKIAIPFKFVRQ